MVGQAADEVFGIISHQENANQNHETSPHAHEDGYDDYKGNEKFRVSARCWNRHTRVSMVSTCVKWCGL